MLFLGELVSAVIFDMDGLLLDTERISLLAWQAGAAAVGVSMPDSVFLDMIGRCHQDCLAVLHRFAGHDLDFAAISAAMFADYERRLAQSIPVMPGARELLTFLHAAGLPLAVATSSRRDLAEHKLRTVGFLPYFRSVTGGDTVERGKPAPDIYLAAADTLNIPPEECVAFEDSSPGTESAAAAGMRAVIVPDLKAPTPEARAVATAQIVSLLEAPALFSTLG